MHSPLVSGMGHQVTFSDPTKGSCIEPGLSAERHLLLLLLNVALMVADEEALVNPV